MYQWGVLLSCCLDPTHQSLLKQVLKVTQAGGLVPDLRDLTWVETEPGKGPRKTRMRPAQTRSHCRSVLPCAACCQEPKGTGGWVGPGSPHARSAPRRGRGGKRSGLLRASGHSHAETLPAPRPGEAGGSGPAHLPQQEAPGYLRQAGPARRAGRCGPPAGAGSGRAAGRSRARRARRRAPLAGRSSRRTSPSAAASSRSRSRQQPGSGSLRGAARAAKPGQSAAPAAPTPRRHWLPANQPAEPTCRTNRIFNCSPEMPCQPPANQKGEQGELHFPSTCLTL